MYENDVNTQTWLHFWNPQTSVKKIMFVFLNDPTWIQTWNFQRDVLTQQLNYLLVL